MKINYLNNTPRKVIDSDDLPDYMSANDVTDVVEIENNTIEDFIILRNDGTPTYNLSATVDDHQMGMTHIIRGDDHKINTFKQIQIYQAMGWNVPEFAHIPLIHTIEGKKLSIIANPSCIKFGEAKGVTAPADFALTIPPALDVRRSSIFTCPSTTTVLALFCR